MSYVLSFVFAAILAAGLLARIPVLTYMLFVFQAFGSTALLPPEFLAGSSVTPGSVAILFFVMKALGTRSTFVKAAGCAVDFRRLGFLSLFLMVAVLGAFILPRIFAGAVPVHTMRTGNMEFVAPSMANITQASYLTLSTLLAIAIAIWMQNEAFAKMLPKAILAGAYAVIATGLLDILAHLTGGQEILSYFRTANYVFMTDNYILGTRRVIGLMPEASAYGALAASFCGLLLFLRPVFPPRLWRWKVPAAAWGCGLMAMMSTSSTAYVAMAVVLGIYALYDVHKITPEGDIVRKTVSKKILALLGAGVIVLLIVLFDSDIANGFMNLVDVVIFQKQKSASYADRSALTSDAIHTFFESNGIGVGVGSLRASNFFVVILASTGVVGAGLFAALLWVVFTRRAPNAKAQDRVMLRAAKLSLLPIFAGGALAGTTPDFGPLVATLFGIIAGLGQTTEKAKRAAPVMHKQDKKQTASNSHIQAEKRRRYI